MFKIDNDAKVLDLKGHAVAEITEDWYYGILGAVPPLKQGNNYFICGEPTCIKDGCFTYTHLLKKESDNGECKFYAFAAMIPTNVDVLEKILDEELHN